MQTIEVRDGDRVHHLAPSVSGYITPISYQQTVTSDVERMFVYAPIVQANLIQVPYFPQATDSTIQTRMVSIDYDEGSQALRLSNQVMANSTRIVLDTPLHWSIHEANKVYQAHDYVSSRSTTRRSNTSDDWTFHEANKIYRATDYRTRTTPPTPHYPTIVPEGKRTANQPKEWLTMSHTIGNDILHFYKNKGMDLKDQVTLYKGLQDMRRIAEQEGIHVDICKP